jgi:hypothetical protein
MTYTNQERTHTSRGPVSGRTRSAMHAVVVTLLFGMMSIEQPSAADAFVQSSMAHRQPAVAAVSSVLFSSSSSDIDGGAGEDIFTTVEFQQALEQKNASRQKFGVKPLSPQEFSNLQSQVQQLEQEQLVKRQQQQAAAAAALVSKPQLPLFNFAKQLLASATDDTCYSNLDCERPKICCDLGFKKMCCSSGMKILETKHELARIPVYGGSSRPDTRKKY